MTTSLAGSARARGPYVRVPAHLSSPRAERASRLSWTPFVLSGLVIATLGMRVMEFVGALAVIRPVVLSLLIAGAIFLIREGADGVMRPLRRPWTRWLLAFTAWAIITVPFAFWRGFAFATVRDVTITVGASWLLLALPMGRLAADRLQAVLIGCGVLFAALILTLGGEVVDGRYGATIGMDVNDIALIMATCLPLAVGMALRARAHVSLAWWTTALLFAAVVVRSGSRGGALAVLAGAVVLLLGSPWKRSLTLLLIGLPVGFALWTQAPPAFRQRMTDLFSGVEDYNDTEYEGRKQIWRRGIRYGLENPVTGIGPNGFVWYDGKDLQEQGRTGKWNAAHSLYVQAFAELGVPGAILYLGLFIQLLRVAFKSFRRRSAQAVERRPELLAALVAFAVGSAFLSFLYYPFTWLFFAATFHMADAGAPRDVAGTRERRSLRLPVGKVRRSPLDRVAQPIPAGGFSAIRR